MTKLRVQDVTLVTHKGQRTRVVSMLTLEEGSILVLPDKMSKKTALSFALQMVVNSIKPKRTPAAKREPKEIKNRKPRKYKPRKKKNIDEVKQISNEIKQVTESKPPRKYKKRGKYGPRKKKTTEGTAAGTTSTEPMRELQLKTRPRTVAQALAQGNS